MNKSLSVIVATFNSASTIYQLIQSLNSQTVDDFECIFVDNLSSDGTQKIIECQSKFVFRLISEPDSGIYDALNKGISHSVSEYYLVIGSDDYLFPQAIENYLIYTRPNSYVAITSKVKTINGILQPFSRPHIPVIARQFSHFSAHAVGTVFKKSLHTELGLYSTKLKIASDQLFMLKVICVYPNQILYVPFISGFFSSCGISSSSPAHVAYESFLVNIRFFGFFSSLLVFFLRLLRNKANLTMFSRSL